MTIRALRRGLTAILLVSCVVPAAAMAETSADPVSVRLDQAKLIKLPEKVATIVVGNPMIADVTLQAGGVVVVTGKGYGVTNVLAMDRRGEVLIERRIEVEGAIDHVVTVYRGVERESYSCMPTCQRRVMLGDSQAYFSSTMEQSGTLNDKATTPSAKN